jgi:hypothetical protein
MKTILFALLCIAAISCQESPSPALSDDPTDDSENLFETVSINPLDTNLLEISTSLVELDTTVTIPDPFIPTTLWPVETETISFEPNMTNWNTVDTETVEDVDTSSEPEDTEVDTDCDDSDTCSHCHCGHKHCKKHCHHGKGHGHCHHGNGHGWGHSKHHCHFLCK